MFDGFTQTPEPFEVSLQLYLQSVGMVAVYPYRVPQQVGQAYPRTVYTFVSGDHDVVLKGPNGLAVATVQFAVYALSNPDVLVLAEQLRQALHGYQGWMGSAWVHNVNLQEFPGGYDEPVDSGDKGTFSKVVEYEFTYEESVPVFTSTSTCSVTVSSQSFGMKSRLNDNGQWEAIY